MAQEVKWLLADDVQSSFKKGHIYGKKGEQVLQVSRNIGVLIVERKGDRFPVRIEKLIKI